MYAANRRRQFFSKATRPLPKTFFPAIKYRHKRDQWDMQEYDFIGPNNQIEIIRDGYVDDYSYRVLPEHRFWSIGGISLRHSRNFLRWIHFTEMSGRIIPNEVKNIVWKFMVRRRYSYLHRKLGKLDIPGPHKGIIFKFTTKSKKKILCYLKIVTEQNFVLLNQNYYADKNLIDHLLQVGTMKSLSHLVA